MIVEMPPTEEFVPNPEEPKVIQKLRKIVAEKQYAKVNGMTVDLFTASTVVQVYDALNEENKAKFTALSLPKMVGLTWKLVG